VKSAAAENGDKLIIAINHVSEVWPRGQNEVDIMVKAKRLFIILLFSTGAL